MTLEALLALRFLKGAPQEKSIASMVTFCFLSIFISTFSLALVSAIMNGLEQETRKKLQGIHADVYIDAGKRAIDYEKVKKVLCSEFSSSVATSSPTSFFHALLVHKQQERSSSSLCLVKVIDPQTEPLVTVLHKTVQKAEHDASKRPAPCEQWEFLSSNSLCIGQSLAERLDITQGDTITLYYPEEQDLHHTMSLRAYEVQVKAFYKTGIQELDEQMVIASFDLLKKLYRPTVSQIMLKLTPQADEQKTISSLQKRFALPVYSWKQLYTPLFSALKLEKYAMIIILLLLAFVTCTTIIALLYMYALQKRSEIALLKAMGMSNSSITKLFITLAALITMSGTALGIIAAFFATVFLKTFPFIRLPDTYYVTYLPAELTFPIVLAILLGAALIALFAGTVPARMVHSETIARTLKGMFS